MTRDSLMSSRSMTPPTLPADIRFALLARVVRTVADAFGGIDDVELGEVDRDPTCVGTPVRELLAIVSGTPPKLRTGREPAGQQADILDSRSPGLHRREERSRLSGYDRGHDGTGHVLVGDAGTGSCATSP